MDIALIIPDTHRPFHSRRAYDLMLEVACYIKPKEIVLLGDYADYYSVSRHIRNPQLPQMLQEEVQSVNEGLDEIDSLFPEAKKVYLEGNHEIRLETYLCTHAPALFGLTESQFLFRLNERPLWTYQPFGRMQGHRVLGAPLIARHRPLAGQPKTSLQRAGISNCYGDIHKIEEAWAVTLDGREQVGFCPGWLGDPRLKAFDYALHPPQWQWGFALVAVDPSSPDTFHHQIISIKPDYSCVVWGKQFKL